VRKTWQDISSSVFFLGPGVGLLVGFSILPICLAVYMSVHRWRPVQGRFLGADHYQKALGDITSALIVLAAFSALIVGAWLLTRDWRQLFVKKALIIVLAVLTVLLIVTLFRAIQLQIFVNAYLEGMDWAYDAAPRMFIDRWSDPEEQVPFIARSARSLFGAVIIISIAKVLVGLSIVRQSYRRLFGRASGVLVLYSGGQIVSVGWEKMMGSGDSDFLNSLIQTVFYSIGTISLQVSLGLIIAFALYRRLRGFRFFRFIIFLPYVVPVVAMATVFRLMYGSRESSLSNQFLSVIGVEPLRWIADSTPITSYLFGLELSGLIAGPSLGMLTVIMFGVFSYTGYNAVILLAGLTSIPLDLYEAAELEGATAWQTFRHITMPLLSPIIFFLVITGLIGTFQAFTHIYIMLGPIVNESIHTGVIMIWRQIEIGKIGYASALSVILFVLIILLTIWQFSLFSRFQEFGE
jgi:multiple sugar transport system permease protein